MDSKPVAPPGAPLLSVEDLVVRFRTRDTTVYAVNGVSFSLDPGETLGIVGESGCGKSVTSLAITRLVARPAGHIERGRIVFDGRDLLGLPEDDMLAVRGHDIAMVFQDPLTSLNPILSIERQLTEGILAHETVSKDDARRQATGILREVGVPDPERLMRSYPHQLSGGMRQRVMIAMALAMRPKLLIADEPTTALDVTIQAQVIEVIRALTTEYGTAVLLITHDLGVVADITERIAVMYAGFIVETATTDELFAAPRHPYTVGLLKSVSRIDVDSRDPLVPIEGAPPDQSAAPVGCPFAPRCGWRLDICWTRDPILAPADDRILARRIVASGPDATHLIACHNPATPEEVSVGRPLRDGFLAAPPPDAVIEAVERAEPALREEIVVFDPDTGQPHAMALDEDEPSFADPEAASAEAVDQGSSGAA